MTIVYESTRRGRMAVDFHAEDLSVIGTHQVDPEPIAPSVNGPVRLRDPSYPAIAFIAPKGNASVLAVAPLACVGL